MADPIQDFDDEVEAAPPAKRSSQAISLTRTLGSLVPSNKVTNLFSNFACAGKAPAALAPRTNQIAKPSSRSAKEVTVVPESPVEVAEAGTTASNSRKRRAGSPDTGDDVLIVEEPENAPPSRRASEGKDSVTRSGVGGAGASTGNNTSTSSARTSAGEKAEEDAEEDMVGDGWHKRRKKPVAGSRNVLALESDSDASPLAKQPAKGSHGRAISSSPEEEQPAGTSKASTLPQPSRSAAEMKPKDSGAAVDLTGDDSGATSPTNIDPPAAKRLKRLDGLGSGLGRAGQGLGGGGWLPLRSAATTMDSKTRQAEAVQILQNRTGIYRPGNLNELQAEEDLLCKCEQIAVELRRKLGGGCTEDGYHGTASVGTAGSSGGASGSAAGPGLVTREDLQASCGEIALSLKDYQMVGINFLMLHYQSNLRGAILADEMGLGKTAQTICFLGGLRTLAQDPGPHLIVCPASLIENWQRELKRWCPAFRTVVFYGSDRADKKEVLRYWRKQVQCAFKDGRIAKLPPGVREPKEEEEEGGGSSVFACEDIDQEEALDVLGIELPEVTSGSPPFDIMLTTYTMFEKDSADYKADRAFLTTWHWSYLVADEAHALKNRDSTRTKKLKFVAKSCQRRILLTGTPLQNDLGELQALLGFLLPQLFKDDSVDALSAEPLDGESAEEAEARLVQRIKVLLAPFILRRLKSEVASQLVAKQQVVELLDMEKEQEQVYRGALETIRAEVAQEAAKKVGKGRGRGKASASSAPPSSEAPGGGALVSCLSRTRINNIFTHLRKVAQHPLLVRHRFTDEQVREIASLAHRNGLFGGGAPLERIYQELEGYSDHMLHNFAESHPKLLSRFVLPPEAALCSAKVQHLAHSLLPQLQAAGSRVLLFSQWTSVLDVLEWVMQTMGWSYVRLDGSTQVDERLALCDTFNNPDNDVFVFLLSTRAGGQGLNLTGADTVILHDVDFNPQVDRQAEDRSHRLGQTRPVTVYRLVTKGTVDQNILDIANRKLALDAAVLEDLTVNKRDGGKQADKQTDDQHMGAILAQLLSGS